MKSEPILILMAGVANVVQAVLVLLVAFGLTLSADQTAAIMALTTIVTNLVVAVVARSKVTPV